MKMVELAYRQDLQSLDRDYPTDLLIPNGRSVQIAAGDAAFGVSMAHEFELHHAGADYAIPPRKGTFFSIPGPAEIDGLRGMICVRHDYTGLLLLGATEDRGRLRYIDGCSDTLLLAPPRKGDPCVNYLHVPPGISQTRHTHPSVRVGLVLEGNGVCWTPEGEHPMLEGRVFILPALGLHSFHTTHERLEIVVFHPDSDFGPTEDNHPMINRTFIDERPAAISQVGGGAPL